MSNIKSILSVAETYFKMATGTLSEKLDPRSPAGDWIHDFVHSTDPKFAGKSADERKQQALAAYYQARRDAGLKEEEEAGKTEATPTGDLTPDKDNLAATDAADAQKKQEPQHEIPSWVPGNIPDGEKKEFAEAAKKAWESDNNTFDFKGRTYKITESIKNEELVGNQKKLDVNGNGKIDADDLKKLRAGHPANENLEKETETPGQETEMPEGQPRGDGDNDEDDKTDMGDEDEKGEMKEAMSAIVTRKNADGSYDEVGMNNRRIVGGSHSNIMKKAAEYAKGPHRVELFHGDRVGYGAPHKVVHVESTQINEGPGQTNYARMATDHAEKASERANKYGGQDYHLHMIAHHHHALAAKSHERAADNADDENTAADHSGGASYHHDQADHHLKAAKGLMKEATDNPTDKLTLDVPAMIRSLEKAREDFKSDEDVHNFVQGLLAKKDSTIDTNALPKDTVKEGAPGDAKAGPMVIDPLTQATKDDHDDETKVEDAPYTNKADGSENVVPADKPSPNPTPMNKLSGEQVTRSVAEAYLKMTEARIVEAYVKMTEAQIVSDDGATHTISEPSQNPQHDDHVHSKPVHNWGWDSTNSYKYADRLKEKHPHVQVHIHPDHFDFSGTGDGISFSGKRKHVADALHSAHYENRMGNRDMPDHHFDAVKKHPEVFKNYTPPAREA